MEQRSAATAARGLQPLRQPLPQEVEKALQGKQSAKEAIDNSIKRGNAALRAFEKTAATN